MWMIDPKNKKESITLTFFVWGFIIALIKLIISGIVIGTFTISPFTGIDFAAVITALGGIYSYRRSKHSKGEENGQDKSSS